MLQFRKAEERRGSRAQRQLDGTEAFLDLVLSLLLGEFLAVQIGMRPGVRADGMAGRGHLLENLGMVARMLADREEQTLGAFVRERLQNRGRVSRPRPVVEGQ